MVILRQMIPSPKRFWSTTKLRVICLSMWLAILMATLWPFDPLPSNEVNWLPGTNGVHFGRHGIVTSAGAFRREAARDTQSSSVEILLRAGTETEVHTFLGFYAPGDLLPFELRQYGDGLLIFRRSRDGQNRVNSAEIDVEHVFHHGQFTMIAITSGARGTEVYLNGELAQTAPGYHIFPSNFSGQLLLGAAPINYDAWSGDVRELAFYSRELSAAQVRQHFSEASRTVTQIADTSENTLAEYLFNEGAGTIVHDRISSGPNLEIAKHFQVPYKWFLAPPWKEITPLWIYVDDIVRNVVGFVPLGMLLYLYLLRVHGKRRAILEAIVLVGLTSLGIEILQWFIPQRDSGITDIITNTSGTGLGVLLLQPRPIRVMLETLGVMSTPRDAASCEHGDVDAA
jgi:hypothetical protein